MAAELQSKDEDAVEMSGAIDFPPVLNKAQVQT